MRFILTRHYERIASFLTPWEELPLSKFLFTVSINKKGETIYQHSPLRHPGWTHRHTVRDTDLISFFGTLQKMRSRGSGFVTPGIHLSIHASSYFERAALNLLHLMIIIRWKEYKVYSWYLSLLGRSGSMYGNMIDYQCTILNHDEYMDKYLFHLRQRDEEGFSTLNMEMLCDTHLKENLSWRREGGIKIRPSSKLPQALSWGNVPSSLLLEIFLDGWKQKYYLARYTSTYTLYRILPSLLREGRFDEILWLLSERVPYSEREVLQFTTYGIEDHMRKLIPMGKPLLSLPLFVASSGILGTPSTLEEVGVDERKIVSTIWREKEYVSQIMGHEKTDVVLSLPLISPENVEGFNSHLIVCQVPDRITNNAMTTMKLVVVNREATIQYLVGYVSRLRDMYREALNINLDFKYLFPTETLRSERVKRIIHQVKLRATEKISRDSKHSDVSLSEMRRIKEKELLHRLQ